MALSKQLSEYIRACFTGIWIESHEQQDALTEIAQLCQQEGWQLATWNIEQGLRGSGAAVDSSGGDPLAAIRAVSSLATPEGTAVMVLQFPNLAEQGAAMNRIAALIEKAGAPRDRVLSDTELHLLITGSGDNAQTFYQGFTFRGWVARQP